jgi:hypothetical protein
MRRGSVLLAVLVVIVLGALIGTVMLSRAVENVGAVRSDQRDVQLRALAWSGVQGVMQELSAQRAVLLRLDADGRGRGGSAEEPSLTRTWTVFDEGGERGVVRLLPVRGEGESVGGGAEESASDVVVRSEAACLHAKEARPGMLESLLGKAIAEKLGRDRDLESAVQTLLDDAANENTVVTMWSYEPNIQLGLGTASGSRSGSADSSTDGRGKSRISLEGGWSALHRDALLRRMNADDVKKVEGALVGKPVPSDLGGIVGLLRAGGDDGVPRDQWGVVLDVLTTGTDLFVPGRADVNIAPRRVLAAIPGVGEEIAGKIVAMRANLDREAKRDVTWPMVRGVMTPEQFQLAVGWLCVRSAQWRVRVEALIEPATQATGSRAISANGPGRDDGGTRMVWEVIVDVSEPRPRVLWMRDVTWLGSRFEIASAVDEDETDAAEKVDVEASRLVVESSPSGLEKGLDKGLEIGRVPRAEVSPTANASEERAPVSGGEARALVDRRSGRWIGGSAGAGGGRPR